MEQRLRHVAQRGQGYFCIVKQYHDDDSGVDYALKHLKKEHYKNDEYRYRLNREILLLKELKGCDNIIELINFGEDVEDEMLWYLMPFAKNNLYQYIKRHNGTLSNERRIDIIKQIIKAIKFAHNKNILHRDISPNNVLVFW